VRRLAWVEILETTLVEQRVEIGLANRLWFAIK
jgi:hypothetical protein